ncbi:MAG: efflux RND transporter periplasmic adaptor subunit [Kofleriaceae bacterium]
MNPKLARWIPRVIVIALIAAVTTVLWIKKPWEPSAPEITFATVNVTKGSISAQVTAAGTLSARTTVQVGAQVSGRVVKLYADFNDKVKKGQTIAKLDDQLLKGQIDQSQAAYDLAVANEKKAEVALNDGERQYKRQKGLEDQQLVAATTVEGFELTRDTAKAALAASKASVGQAYANLVQAKTNLSYATIYSPIDGVILTRSYDEGQTVQSSFSAPTLFTIAADLSVMQIDTAVAEGDVGRLADGMKATFTVDAHPGMTFEGAVRQVRNSPTTTSGVVTYDAVIDVDNHESLLRPGMTANVTFVLQKVDDVVKIPNAALRFKPTRDQIQGMMAQFGGGRGSGSGHHRGSGSGDSGSGGRAMGGMAMGGSAGGKGKNPDRKMLFKLVDGKPKMVFVKLGLTDGSTTQLLEGDVDAGDALITEVQGLPAQQRKVGAF